MRRAIVGLLAFLVFAALASLPPQGQPRSPSSTDASLSNIDAAALVDTYVALKSAMPSLPPEYVSALGGDLQRLEALANKYGVTLPPVYAGVVSAPLALDDVAGTVRRYMPRVERPDVKLILCTVQRHVLRFLLEEHRKTGYVPRSIPSDAWRAYVEEEGGRN